MTETPATLTYSSVVSRDSVRIALTLAALNDLQVMSCDIQNAYLTADCREKIWTYAGPEFGSEQGSIMFVRKALYRLKSLPFGHILQKPCMISASTQQGPIQMSGDDQPKRLTARNIMNIFYAMLMIY